MVSRNRAPAILAHACIDPWRSSFAFGTAVIVGFLLARQYDTRHIHREGDESDVHAGHVQAGLRTLRGRSPDQRLPPASALLAGVVFVASDSWSAILKHQGQWDHVKAAA